MEYVQAQRFRLRFRQEVERLFDQVDMLLTPTLPFTAPPMKTTEIKITEDLTVSTLSGNMKYTAIPSMSGTPAMSIPIGFDEDMMLIGMQIIVPAYHEERAFAFAKTYQKLTDFHKQYPL